MRFFNPFTALILHCILHTHCSNSWPCLWLLNATRRAACSLIGQFGPAGYDAAGTSRCEQSALLFSLYWCDWRSSQSHATNFGKSEAGPCPGVGVRPVCVAPCRDVVHRTRRNPHSAQFVWETVVEAFYPRLRFVNKTKMFPQNQTRDSRWAKIELHGRLTWYFCPSFSGLVIYHNVNWFISHLSLL